jgi:sarcosine oxidase
VSIEPPFDVAVVGLGAMGSAAVHHLVARGARVVGFEQFEPVHEHGSSHGDTRMFRLGYFEGGGYVPLLRRAYDNWRALERETGADLLTVTGVLHIGPEKGELVTGVIAASEMHGLPHEVFDPETAGRRFPQFAMESGELAVLDPAGGFVLPETTIRVMHTASAGRGAVLRFGTRVLDIAPGDGGVAIRTGEQTVRARKAIIAAGSYVDALVPRLKGVVKPIRTVVGWYRPRDGFNVAPGRMPAYLRQVGEDSFFGFPMVGAPGMKFGRHGHLFEDIDPEAPNPSVNDRDRALLDDFARDYLPAAGEGADYATCRYTLLPDDYFLIDRLPGEPNVIVASPCSGHGFKFVPVVGEILADMALEGGTCLPVGDFTFAALDGRAGRASRHGRA